MPGTWVSSEAFMAAYPDAMDFAAARAYSLKSVGELARRAHMMTANRGIHALPTAARGAASRRFAALVIQAFRASPRARVAPTGATVDAGVNPTGPVRPR